MSKAGRTLVKHVGKAMKPSGKPCRKSPIMDITSMDDNYLDLLQMIFIYFHFAIGEPTMTGESTRIFFGGFCWITNHLQMVDEILGLPH